MRRILLLITDLEIGGTPTVVRELAIRLNDPPRLRVEVACLGKWGPVADQLRDAGIEVAALGAAGVRDLPSIVWRFVKLVRERQIDTVFSFLIHANVVAAIGSVFLRQVRFIQSIQTTQPRPRWHWWLQAIAHFACERVVVPSESVVGAAREWAGVPRYKIDVIPNAVDVGVFSGERRSHGPEARVTVGFLGRLDPIKRVPDLVDALVTLDDRFQLDIYGEGPDRWRIELLVETWGYEDRVILHGVIDNPQAAIAGMDVLVLPSEAEGFGLVLIEAMAARVPVVATDAPGIRDVVRDGETGLLVPVGHPNDIAKAIRRVIEDDALRETLINNAYEEVRHRFSWPAVLQQYRRVLNLEEQ